MYASDGKAGCFIPDRPCQPPCLLCRCYVLLGGRSPLVLSALQDQACSWAAEEYTASPLSELAWSLAWAKRPPTPAMAAHLAAAVQQEQRDWGAWLGGARAGRLVMLLWGLASLRCQPCAALLEAACQRLQQVPLSGMPTKVGLAAGLYVHLRCCMCIKQAAAPYSRSSVPARCECAGKPRWLLTSFSVVIFCRAQQGEHASTLSAARVAP